MSECERMKGEEVTGAWRELELGARLGENREGPRHWKSMPAPHLNEVGGLLANAVHKGGTGRQVLGRLGGVG